MHPCISESFISDVMMGKMSLMKKSALMMAVILSMSMFVSLSAGASGSEEIHIHPEESAQLSPRIYGNLVVWEDYRNDPTGGYSGEGTGNPDIYLYNISSRREMPICTQVSGDGMKDSAQQNPDIWKNLIVWEDWRNGNADIYIYDLSDANQPANGTRLTFNPANQVEPRIWGHYVVWIDYRNGLDGDVYAYDLSVDSNGDGIPNWKERSYGAGDAQMAIKPLCVNIYEQKDVAISGNIVVWKDYRNDTGNGDRNIFGYNLKTGKEFQITSEKHNQFQPAIYGDKVVWADTRNGNSAVYGKNLTTGSEFRVSPSNNSQRFPAIWKDRVVWVERINGKDVLKMARIGMHAGTVVSGSWDQHSPAISGMGVVWTDDRETKNINGREYPIWNVYFLRDESANEDRAPVISDINVSFNGKEPKVSESINITVTAHVYDPEGDNFTVTLTEPDGTQIRMYDDGAHSDGKAGDGVFGAEFTYTPKKGGEHDMVIHAEDEYGVSSEQMVGFTVRGENPFIILWGAVAVVIVFLLLILFAYVIRKKSASIEEAEKTEKK